RESNYLAAVCAGEPTGLAWVELSTGRFHAACVPAARLADELARIGPAECLERDDATPLPASAVNGCMITRRPAWAFAAKAAGESLSRHFGIASLEGFGFEAGDTPAISAAG